MSDDLLYDYLLMFFDEQQLEEAQAGTQYKLVDWDGNLFIVRKAADGSFEDISSKVMASPNMCC